MTVRELINMLQPYAFGAEDGAECEITDVDYDGDDGTTPVLVIDMGSDIHRLPLKLKVPR